MKKIFLFLFISSFIAACSAVQTGSLSRAYETYEEKDYQRTLELISFAQNVNDTSSELSAELSYLKAQTYAQLGMKEQSDNLFRHLAEQHKNTEYGYLAHKKIKD